MNEFFAWLREYHVLLSCLFGASALMFVGSLIAVPWLVVRIPSDYFVNRRRFLDRWQPRYPWLRIALVTAKNIFGIILILAGVAMGFLPGPGLLTFIAGVTLVDFPGKFAFESWLVRRRPLLSTINRMRRRAGRTPLELPPPAVKDSD
ncbi:MAG: hypothetical protein GX594_01865 [Pirellulaceae bacterium]|nr:hypothetical protein [Pirellulaceae bacterium]